ncbi:hypothetical protein JXA63_03530 [Candidatus Woesebacteria bacterium]|nr:hypothetical protein [Candidatus Woesebacteria bacterium]
MEEAVERMRIVRNKGGRVSIALGSYDVGTDGQKMAISEFSWATHSEGELFILVGGDKEVAAERSIDRPYLPHGQRMEFVAQQPGVDWVAPISLPGFRNKDELIRNYGNFHHQLSGMAHCRLIGDKEDTYPIFLQQCNQAGILLIHSESPRKSRATDVGRELFKRI